jgi:hypothetical protein
MVAVLANSISSRLTLPAPDRQCQARTGAARKGRCQARGRKDDLSSDEPG